MKKARRIPYKPFEIIRLIRNGVVQNVSDLDIPSSLFFLHVRDFEARLIALGLIEVDVDGSVRMTDRWTDLAGAFGLSLSNLSFYNEDSVICTPIFGPPGSSAVEADVFVLMPFESELQPVYDDHISAVAVGLDLTVARADDFSTATAVVRDVWNAINSCRLVIADCTGKNPNVFYEIGIAHTLGKSVILISQSMDDVPFDVKHIRAIVYDFTPRGMQDFEAKLRSTIENVLSTQVSLEDIIHHFRSPPN